MAKKKKATAARQVSSPREPENPAPAPGDVDISKPGDPDTPAPRASLMPTFRSEEEKASRDVSKAAVVEPNDVDEDEKGTRSETVIATRAGYYGHKRREPGEAFVMHFKGKKGFLPSWVRLAEDEDVPKRQAEVRPAEGDKPAKTKEVDVLNNSRPYAEGGNNTTPDAGRTVI